MENSKNNDKACHEFQKLVDIMKRLRNVDNGCPWDLKQTHTSIRPYLIEETYEVVDAIDSNDMAKLKEELGDLLLQIVFHSQIESENSVFAISDVIQHINEKMIRRHPHIFGNISAPDAETVLKNWEEIKKTEGQQRNSLLDGIPRHMPALLKARRIQERASTVGFDWGSIKPVIDKINEEINEFMAVYETDQPDSVEDELGDIFFALVNLCRFSQVDPEKALNRTNDKFIKRFQVIEKELEKQGKKFSETTLEEMDEIWNQAKKIYK